MNKEPKSLTSTITGWSQHFPEKTAVKSEFPSVSVSYLELEAYTNRIANFLHGKVTGVPHVVILLDKSPGLIASIIGILKCGLVFITINPSLPPARIKIMVETTQAEWIITNEKYTKIVNDTGITGLKILLTDTLAHEPGLGQDYFYLEAGPGNDALTFDPIYNKECYIFFTSGSTGVPKAVLGRQKSLLHFLQWEIKEFNVNEHCRISQFTSPSFDPFLRDVFVPLLAGGTCCIPAQDTLMNMKQLIHWIAENKITLIHTVPSLFKQMLSEIESGDCFTHLENILLAGELLRGQDIAPFIRLFKQRIQLVNFCGPTETTLAKLFYRIQPGDENRSIIPVGKPIEGAEILILDNLMRKCPTGKKGEIYIRTPFRSAGYYNDPALTRQVFLQNPYSHHANDLIYKSGDLGRELPDGNIELLGRIDFQVKIRGFRIEVGEIENRLLTHPGIRDSVVTAVENENGEKYLCAYVVFSPGLQTAATELKKHLAAELPDYMIPSYFVKLEHLPLTATGKIDRTALPAPQPEVDVNYIVPADETEKKLVKIWSEILHKKENQISVEANFFELGGHSLKAAALAAKIHKEFNVNVPLSELFKITTIRELSRYIRRGEKECYLEITPCEKKFFYPLSPAQKRLYLLQAMAENSSAYNIPQMMKITGRLEVEKLRNAFNTLIQRHESLRTSFHMINDEPVQRIRDTVEFEIEYLAADACGVHGQTRPTNGENGNLLKFIKPFDLTQAPLLRVILVRLAEEEDILTVDMHHIISDGISITILIRDFLALYAGKELPEIKLQYKDYAQWLSRENKSKNILTQAEYWRQQFAGEIPLLALPTDFIRPDVQSFAGNRTSFEIDSQTLGTLQALALEAGATLYIVLLALYNIFLAKLSGQEDIVVGSPVAGRNHTDLERIIGIFVNTLAIRNFLLGEKIFSEFLLEVKQKVLNAFENQDFPYEDLVEQVVINRDTGRNPLFDAMFILQNMDMEKINIPGLKMSPYPYEHKTSKFDLTLSGIERGGKLLFIFEYSTVLFKEETIKRFINYFKNIISGFTPGKNKKISAFEIITGAEKEQILYEFNNTAAEYPQDKTIHQLFAEQVEKSSDRIALVGAAGGEEKKRRREEEKNVGVETLRATSLHITYLQLNKDSDHLAGLLIEKGVQADIIVAIMMERSIEMIIGILGIMKAGGGYLPIDPEYPQERIDYMLKDSGAKLLAVANDKEGEKVRRWEVKKIFLEEIFKSQKISSYPLILLPSYLLNPSNLAYVIYTSGSTGNPKGVIIEHRAVLNFIEGITRIIEFKPGKTILALTTISFDIFGLETLLPFCRGLKVVMATENHQREMSLLEKLIIKNCIDMLQATPSRMQIFTMDETTSICLKDLKEIIVGGETFPGKLLEDLKRSSSAKIYNMYGPTETTIWSSVKKLEGTESISIGKPIINTQIYILSKYLQIQPIGIPGEIYIGGSGMARGYLNRVELTAEKFIYFPNLLTSKLLNFPLYRTGDMARWLADGCIEFLGRMDYQVKIKGFRIELEEIEKNLKLHENIKDAVVIADGEGIYQYLCAYIVSPLEIGITELREYLQEKLPEYMIPSNFVKLEKIPLTPNGKLNRRELPKPGLKAGGSYIAPRNDIERKLVDIWSEVLATKKSPASQLQISIGIDDNFFHLGGHSLKAMILASNIHKEFDVKVPLAEIFRAPVIRQLAKYIREKNKEFHISIEPVEKREYYALSSAQKRLYFLQQLDLNTTGYNMPMVLPLGKEIKKEKLAAVLKQLITRHESLRTSFERINGEVSQRVHEYVEFELEYLATDASGVHRQTRTLNSFIRPFDLAKAPLIRSGLVEHADGHYTWIVDIHHIVSDGTSHTILTEDFMQLYNSEVPLAPLPVQYKDFAQWQNQLFAEGRIKEQEDYWLALYAGEIPRLNIPGDYKRPALFTFAGDRYMTRLEREDALRFKTLGAKFGGTLYMNMMTALNVLFYKYTGQNDIIVGSGIAGRRHDDIQGVVGMFVNTLAMRNYPEGDKSYDIFLQEVIANSVKAFENQDVQFEELVEKLAPERDLGRNPLFDVSMMVQNFQKAGSNFHLEIINENHPGNNYKNKTAKFDLTYFVLEAEEDVYINLEYYSGLFKEETIQRMMAHLKNVISAVVKESKTALKDIDILSEKEKEQVLFEFNDTRMEFPKDKTIHALIEEQAAKTSGSISLIYNNQMISYRELERQADGFAHYLYHDKNIALGEPVGVWLEEPMYRQIALLGILKAGGAFIPLDPALPLERIAYIINDAKIGVLISEKHFLRDLNRLQWSCAHLHSYLCIDSANIHDEEEQEQNELMDQELWHHVGESAADQITGGGWLSSYTGLPFSHEEMTEYGDNIFKKLELLLNPAMKVLEIGCASGISMFRLAPKVGLYYGTDLSKVIIEKNKKVVQEKRINNIELSCLAAHEIEQIPVKVKENGKEDFDLVIINSVIQCFHGHNYLRHVLQKAVSLLKDNGYLFIGDVMDQEKKKDLIKELTSFKEANRDKGYTTKTDFSAELFVSKGFWHDLKAGWPEIESLKFSDKLFTIENELTKFRYDVLIKVNKHGQKEPASKLKYQDDIRAIMPDKWPNWQDRYVSAHDLAYIIYTSGSTGKPKGVMVEHDSLINFCYWHNIFYHINSFDRATRYAGFSFDAAVSEFFPFLLAGSSIYMVPEEIKLDMEKLNDYYEQYGVTVSFLPTQVAEQFMTIANTSLRVLEVAGDKLNIFIKRNYQCYNCYGPSENTICASSYPIMKISDNIPIGKPIANNQIHIFDKDNHLQPVGVPGELCLGGASLARGYLNNPELTEKQFKSKNEKLNSKNGSGALRADFHHSSFTTHHSPLYHTGDLARWLINGNVEFLGRIDQQVKIRGFRIELGEIESHICKHEAVKDASVIVRHDGFGDHYLCAYIVWDRHSDSNDLSELKEYLGKQVPEYMIPLHFIPLEKIPLTPNGKLDLKALPEPMAAAPGAAFISPGSDIETKMAEIWANILHIDKGKISMTANFFELGGHSLKAAVLIANIHEEFNVKVPLAEVFKTPTIKELAQFIKTKEENKFSPIPLSETKEYYPLSSAQKRLFVFQELDNLNYHRSVVSLLQGNINLKRLEKAFKNLIQRHESFRTSIHLVNNQPVQRIAKEVEFNLDYHEHVNNPDLEQTIIKNFMRPFDLSRAPLLRIGVIKKSESKHVLMFDMHHIIYDGISLGIFEKDLWALYRGETLPPLRIQYKDFAVWQNSPAYQLLLKEQEAYWQKVFKKEIVLLNLPTDYPRPFVREYEGSGINSLLSKEITSKLKEMISKYSITLFTLLLTIYNILFHKYTGQDDVIVGTSNAGRSHADLQNIIGMFVNMVIMRNFPTETKTFNQFLIEVKDNVLNAFENQDYPYEELLRKLNLQGNASRDPLNDAVFGVSNFNDLNPIERNTLEAGNVLNQRGDSSLQIRPYKYQTQSRANFDLQLMAIETGDQIHLLMMYSTRLYKPSTVRQMLDHFIEILKQVLEDDSRQLKDILLPHHLASASTGIEHDDEKDFIF